MGTPIHAITGPIPTEGWPWRPMCLSAITRPHSTDGRIIRGTGRFPTAGGGEVLLNLLLNAIQSMDKPGVIRVSLQSDDDDVLIAVADEGKGIPPEHLPNIFRPFFTTKGHGTGLGLSLARRMVEAHGGGMSTRRTRL